MPRHIRVPVVGRALSPVGSEFVSVEALGGTVLLAATVAGFAWANVAGSSYDDLWSNHLSLAWMTQDLRHWVNDGLMTLFFFVVGLEIKRELVRGELRDPRAAALPAIAALGGMIIPALIYTAFNSGGAGADGWGIPMATDIAFAVGVLSLLGKRTPSALIVFLLTLAIVDDLGAIVVIAVFYTSSLAFSWLGAAVGCLLVAVALKKADVRALMPYVLLAAMCWVCLHESGVHATLAGVAFGLLTPSRPFIGRPLFGPRARDLVDQVEAARAKEGTDEPHGAEDEEGIEAEALNELITLSAESQPPLDRLEHRLVPWTTFVVVPIFALANAGVRLTWDQFVESFSQPITLGVLFGLVAGKTIGIFSFTLVAIRIGLGKMPVGTSWAQLFGVAILGGIGFTVALFVTELAFEPGVHADEAKVGILAASAIAGVVGFLFLKVAAKRRSHAA
jgi:NhaA family Na+:H+ antiporter